MKKIVSFDYSNGWGNIEEQQTNEVNDFLEDLDRK